MMAIFMIPVLVHRTKLTVEKAHQMSSEQLWEFHAKELVSLYQNQLDCLKFLAITNATRWVDLGSIGLWSNGPFRGKN